MFPTIRTTCLLLCAVVLSGCPPDKFVAIPKSGDQAPTISISASIVGGQDGSIETPVVNFIGATSPTVVSNATAGRSLTIVGSAVNPGGVQSFAINVTSQNRVAQKLPPIKTVTSLGVKNSDGLVPTTVRILAADDGELVVAQTDDLAIVQVVATNYNGDTTTGTIVYYPIDQQVGHNVQVVDFVLQVQPGSELFSGTFPLPFPTSNVRANGQVLGLINISDGTMHMLTPSGNCTDNDPSVLIFYQYFMICDPSFFAQFAYTNTSSGAKSFGTDMTTLYGTSAPTMPLLIRSCEKTVDPNKPNPLAQKYSLPIRVVYRFN